MDPQRLFSLPVLYRSHVHPLQCSKTVHRPRRDTKQVYLYHRQILHVALEARRGVQGYDLWIQCLASGDWRDADGLPGVHHNVACWHECRCYAERFLRLAGEKLGEPLKPLFNDAADRYKEVRTALCQMQKIFIYKVQGGDWVQVYP